MSEYPAFIVDAFTKKRFAGNQAAVLLIPKVLSDAEYQTLGSEFNLSETAVPVPVNGDFKTASIFSLRWFTPKVEVPLCGHATLATSHALIYEYGNTSDSITFQTKSGDLIVKKHGKSEIEMDFPQYKITLLKGEEEFKGFEKVPYPSELDDVISCLVPATIAVKGVAYAKDAKKVIVVIDETTTRQQFESLEVQFKRMLELHPNSDFIKGIMLTLRPKDHKEQDFLDQDGLPYDYVCRYFAPWVGINEDPATGSAQCALAPFWGAVFGKKQLYAYQSFPGRGAQFNLQLQQNGRIGIIGQSMTVIKGNVVV